MVVGDSGELMGLRFVYEALMYDNRCRNNKLGISLKFLDNIDPTSFYWAGDHLNMEETLFIIISKNFTNENTILNANTCKAALLDYYC